MSTPFFSGDASIANRWLYGSATVLWAGDSIGMAFENRLMQVLRVTPAGFCVQGGRYSSLSAPPWAAIGFGSLGLTALLGEQNYSPMATVEAVFRGRAVPVTGVPLVRHW